MKRDLEQTQSSVEISLEPPVIDYWKHEELIHYFLSDRQTVTPPPAPFPPGDGERAHFLTTSACRRDAGVFLGVFRPRLRSDAWCGRRSHSPQPGKKKKYNAKTLSSRCSFVSLHTVGPMLFSLTLPLSCLTLTLAPPPPQWTRWCLMVVACVQP